MPETVSEAVYLGMSALIVLGIGFIGWVAKRGFDMLVVKVGGVDQKISDLSTEIRKEREARIRSGARLWGEFIAMQRLCAFRHGQAIAEAKNPYGDDYHEED